MRKRILHYLRMFCIFTLMLSMLIPSFGAYAAAGQEPEILFIENFDGCVTNSIDTAFEITDNPNARVVEEKGTNKVLLVPNNNNNTLNALIGQYDADSIVFSVKVKFEGGRAPFELRITDGTTTFIPVSIDESGTITAHDGKKIGSMPEDKWTKFDVVYNSPKKRYSVYIDGACELDMYLYGGMAVLTSMTLRTEGVDGTTVYLDDAAVYTGEKPDSSVRGTAYNPDSTEFIETPESTSSRVFLNNDFNKESTVFSGLSVNNKGNVIGYGEEENGNGYLLIDKTIDNSDPYIDITINSSTQLRNLVIQADLSIKKSGGEANIFSGRDSQGWLNILSMGSDGTIEVSNGSSIVKLRRNRWVNVALVLNFGPMTYDVYVDGEQVVSQADFPNANFIDLSSIRTQMLPNRGNGQMMIDNWRVYESYAPKDISGIEDSSNQSVLPDDSNDIARLRGTVALNLGSDWIFAKTEKKKMDAVPYVTNDRTMIPVRAVSEAFGLETEWDEAEKRVTIGDNIEMQIGSNIMTVDNRDIELDTAPEIKDGRTYIPVRALAEQALNKEVFYCDYGLIVISDSNFRYADDDEALKELSTFVFSERPDMDEIQEAYENSGYKNVHPRLHANADDFARLRAESETNATLKKWTDTVISQADGLLDQEPLEYTIPDGLRLLDTSRGVQDRLLKLGYAYQITGDEKYAERAWKEMEKACSYTDWNPRHFLDTAEMAYGIAVGYDWCYDYLSDEQRETIENAIIKLGLEEGIKQYNGSPTGTNFVFQDMNWNVVCNGGLSAAAFAVLDADPETVLYTLENAYRSFDYMITEFAPDGGWVEGPGYWAYTLKFFCIWMDAMKYPLGTYYNIPNYPGISRTADYIFSLQGNKGANNFNDCGEGDVVSSDVMWLGRYFDHDGITSAYLSYKDLRGLQGNVYDCLYYDTSVSSDEITMPLDNVTRRVESGAMRSGWDNINGMYLSYRGGETLVNHYHISQGAFVLDALGERWALDIGMESLTYSADFTGDRNSLYRIRPEGHNCLVIKPSTDPGQDLNADCPIIKSESKERGAYQVLDLSSAYTSTANEVIRGYMLTADRRTAVIRDEFELKGESEAYWFMHTKADIEIVSNDTAILTQNGKRMQFKLICEGADAELSVMDAEPLPSSPTVAGQTANTGIRKIAVRMVGSGDVALSVRMTPADEYTAEQPFVCGKISSWTIPDGEISPIPQANAILVDGEPLQSFDPQQVSYTITTLNDTVPEVTVDGTGYTVEYLSEAESFDETTRVKLSDGEGRYRIYTISYKQMPILGPVEGRNRLSPISIYASSNPEAENMDYNAADGDLSTRWSADGAQTLTCDFGETVTIDGFAVAAMNGATRQYNFSILVSDDGENFTPVYSGATAGGTDGYEIFSIEPVRARYVQYSGSGNSENTWNSITEFAVFGQEG